MDIIMFEAHSPTTEEDFAKHAGYKYIEKNEFEPGLQKVHEKILMDNGIFDMVIQKCDCVPDAMGKSCLDENCRRRKNFFSCNDDCNPGCQNQPWKKKTFAIDHQKLFLRKYKKKKFAVAACKVIQPNELIGEFVGQVKKANLDENDFMEYSYALKDVGQVIDAKLKGNSLSRINYSCNPNCRVTILVNDKALNLVYQAIRLINPGEDLTVDYGWTFDSLEPKKECFCDDQNCNGVIGNVFKYPNFKMPKHSEDPTRSLSDILDRVACVEKLTKEHLETHKFPNFAKVGAIVCPRDDPIVVPATVIYCLTNKHGLCFYKIHTYDQENNKFFYIPHWLAFQYMEQAEFMLEKAFSEIDIEAIRSQIKGLTSQAAVLNIEHELLPDYAERFFGKTLPKYEPMMMIELNQLKTDEQQDKEDTFDCQLARTVEKNLNKILLMRQFHEAVESLTIFILDRLPKSVERNYHELIKKVEDDLWNHYYNPDHTQRKFLFYEHFRTAIEERSAGSLKLKWCSLCCTPTTFAMFAHLNNHFHKFHSVCARSYKCTKCKFTTPYLSQGRKHLEKVHSVVETENGEEDYVLDAYSDYLGLRTLKNKRLHLVPAGLPTSATKGKLHQDANTEESVPNKKNDTPKGKEQKRKEAIKPGRIPYGRNQRNYQKKHTTKYENSPKYEMDPSTLVPVDASVRGEPTLFNFQSYYTVIKSRSKLNIIKNGKIRYPKKIEDSVFLKLKKMSTSFNLNPKDDVKPRYSRSHLKRNTGKPKLVKSPKPHTNGIKKKN